MSDKPISLFSTMIFLTVKLLKNKKIIFFEFCQSNLTMSRYKYRYSTNSLTTTFRQSIMKEQNNFQEFI